MSFVDNSICGSIFPLFDRHKLCRISTVPNEEEPSMVSLKKQTQPEATVYSSTLCIGITSLQFSISHRNNDCSNNRE